MNEKEQLVESKRITDGAMFKRLWIDLNENGSFTINSPDNQRSCYCESLRELYKELPLEISILQQVRK